jgi:hypothetical protein
MGIAIRLQPLGFLCGESLFLELRATRKAFDLHLGLERLGRSLPAQQQDRLP